MNGARILAAAAVLSAMPVDARAERVEFAARDAVTAPGANSAWQQGKGGGKQEEAGGRGQGGGPRESRGSGSGNGRGGDDARPSGERRQGGGGSARQSERGSSSDRAESGRSSSSSSETRRGGNSGSGRSDEARGGGSSSSAGARSERGNSGASSASSRSERAPGNSASSNASAGTARGASAERRRDRLSGPDLQARIDALPAGLRRMAGSDRRGERMAAGAVARGHARGLPANTFDVRSDGGRVRVLNRSGQLLLDWDDDRDLGSWTLRRLGDRQPAGNAPAFCRSGAGHPVGGREWCLDKGFGLGSRNGTLWSRGGIDDVIWRRPTADRLDRGGLAGVLGDVIFGRLAFQAITLGYDQPLVGFWVAEPEGPRILRVHSGDYEVAEFVDTDRDDRADVLYVVQPVW